MLRLRILDGLPLAEISKRAGVNPSAYARLSAPTSASAGSPPPRRHEPAVGGNNDRARRKCRARAASPRTPGEARASNGERLKPGELEGLVLTYLQEHPAEPLGSGAVAKALQRSSGAVGNGLARLTRAKKVRQVNDKPRRYQIAS
jgi:hypothetical protein